MVGQLGLAMGTKKGGASVLIVTPLSLLLDLPGSLVSGTQEPFLQTPSYTGARQVSSQSAATKVEAELETPGTL